MKKASEILSHFLDESQLEKARSYNSFFRSWRTIAGIDIGSHSRVREIERDVLIIETDHPGWAQMINLKKRRFLQDISKRYPELDIREIRVWIVDGLSDPSEEAVPVAAPEPEDAASSCIPEIVPAEREESEKRVKAAEDPRLRELLSSIGKSIEAGKGKEPRH
jgi:hypothetical protein